MRVFLLLLAPAALASAPDWVNQNGKAETFPAEKYFTGFGEAMLGADKDQAQCGDMARDNAKRALIQSVQVSVKSQTLMKAEENNKDYSQYLSAVTESASALDIQGLKVESYLDAKKSICYALAAAEKAELGRLYSAKAETLGGEVTRLVSSAKTAEEKGDRTKALSAYLRAREKVLERGDAIAISRLSGGKPDTASLPSSSDLAASVDRIAAKPIANLDDAAWAVAYFLKAQAELPDGKVLAQPFTFRDTKMGSPFSRYFHQLLEGKLADTARWTVVEPKAEAAPSGVDFVLSGAYWTQDGAVKLLARLRRVKDGKVAASTEVLVPAPVMAAAKLETKPENYKTALEDQGVFGKGELSGGGLTIEAWTNKGADGLLFADGEKMKIFVRVNLPGYIRFIYHLADGKRAMLLDNYYIDAAKVNRAYELPQEFECEAPFGAETLQAFASTEKFEPLKTQTVGDYEILEEDLAPALVATRDIMHRGLKLAQRAQKAETRLVLTTMEK